MAVLTGVGVTVLMTSELEDRYTDLRFRPYGNAFLADAIVMQRYVEINSQIRRAMIKVRARSQQGHPAVRHRVGPVRDRGLPYKSV